MDFLTSIVSGMHLRSALYARFEATEPWAVRFAAGAERARFGLVTQGRCWLLTDGAAEPLALRAGDCFLLLDPMSFALSDDPRTPTRPCAELMEASSTRRANVIRFGGGGTLTTLITGWFTFDPSSSKPLTCLLPSLMHFRVEDERTSALQATLDLLTLETAENGLGGELVVRSLADLLFVQAVRSYMASANHSQNGLLAGLADPWLSRAIHAMHAEVARRWTVGSLAAVSGMSRSAFAQHFRQTVGQTPLDYLTWWRIHLAMRLLRQGSQPLSGIAPTVGYETDSAFGKAFRRTTGMTPSAYRRSHQQTWAIIGHAGG